MSRPKHPKLTGLALGALLCSAGLLGCKKDVPPPPPLPEKPPVTATTAPAPTPAPESVPAPAAGDTRTALVVVSNDGKILLNGAASSLEAIKKAFGDAATRPTQVHYKRLDPEGSPQTEEAAKNIHELLQFIVDSKIPTSRVL
jgi:hypothetical protein